jgi:chromosomal replication initiation ATPase DnaA
MRESEIYSLIAPMATRQNMRVENFLKDLMKCFSEEKGKSLENVLDAVCKVYHISEELIMSGNKTEHIVESRQMYCFLANRYTRNSLKRIGLRIGKDHSTVIHSINLLNDELIFNYHKRELKNRCVRRLING